MRVRVVHCRRLVEAHILALMIRLFAASADESGCTASSPWPRMSIGIDPSALQHGSEPVGGKLQSAEPRTAA